ncbi:MAG TPA: bifunctional UDP-N-acetylglucosamine diphosphorylase/glucosamine-1-phosphate N-acetyltransferase GlmU [Streptosporangiaceae bacterium]|nr:bifunctional UDP-N-acetylglucosamine diphosphorylase/glucosamine-1-phosphate N-acetyltransferase GlmU [Streptosporangiaceae bacterium]
MSVSRPAAVIVLAAGEGTRMRSRVPKVLHELCGRSMLGHVVMSARQIDPERLIVVAGHGRDLVAAHLAEHAPEARVVVQDRIGGTGHAVRTVIDATGVIPGTVLVTYGDTPLLRAETLARLAAEHSAAGNAVTVLTAAVGDPTGYGRIVRDRDGAMSEIVEERDATPKQRAITEINSGVYAFDGALLADAAKRVSTANAKGEEYLTDVVAILRGDGHKTGTVVAADAAEVEGVNDRAQLAGARRLCNDRLLRYWMLAGVTIVDPATTWIGVDVTLEPDSEIWPGTALEGRTAVGAGARIGPGCVLRDTTVAEGATVTHAVCESAQIGPGASVGPFAYLRPGTLLGPGAKAGTYVELKNAVVGPGSKVPHLTYVGDAEIGEQSNIGAATVFVNYDGVAKHRSTIGDHVRVGSDTMLVAPVHVGDGAYTAAGSVINQDVPPGALAVARARQRNIEGWVSHRRPGTAAARAAEAAQRPLADQAEAAQRPQPDQQETKADEGTGD